MRRYPILTIFWRELMALVFSPIPYFVGAVFLLVSGWFFFSSFFLVNRADLRDFFSLLPLLLSFSIPAVTMRLLAEEFRSGSYELIKTLPVSDRDILGGKFLAAFSLMFLVLLSTLSYPLFISFLGDLDWGPVLGGYVGAFFLVGAYTAIGLFFSSQTKNQVIAFVAASAVCFALSLINFMLPLLPRTLGATLQYLGTSYHFQTFAKGLIDTRDVIYFISMVVIFLFAAASIRGGRKKQIRFASYLVVFVLLNLASGALFFRLDLTKRRIFSLSQASKTALDTLGEPLSVRIFLSDNLPPPYNNLDRDLRDLVEEYRLYAGKNFNYKFHPISAKSGSGDSENTVTANRFGISAIQIPVVEKDQVNLIRAYMGLAVVQGDAEETIPVLSPDENLEFTVTSVIDKINRKISALLRLDEKIKVTLFLSSSLFPYGEAFESYPDKLREVVKNLNRQNYEKLLFSHVDPDAGDNSGPLPSDFQLPGFTLGEKTDGQDPHLAYASLIVQYKKDFSSIPLLSPGIFGYSQRSIDELKGSITAAIDKEVDIETKIGYLTSRETVPFSAQPASPFLPQTRPSISNFLSLMSQKGYSTVPVSLETGIPPEIRTLLVVGPQEPFEEWDLYQLDQFLMRGNSLVFLYDSLKQPSPMAQGGGGYTPLNLHLEPFFEHYGLKVQKSILLDKKSFVQQRQAPGGGFTEIPFYFAPLVKRATISKTSPIMENIKELILLNTSPLELLKDPKGASAEQISVLFSSSDEAWTSSDGANLGNPMAIFPPAEDSLKSYPLAAFVKGPLSSYFEGKPTPAPAKPSPPAEESEKPQPESLIFSGEQASLVDNPIYSTDEGQIFLTGSSFLLSDSLLDPQGNSTNATFLQNLIDVSSGRAAFAAMRSKGQSFNPLQVSVGPFTSFVKWFNIFGLPFLVLLKGGFIWLNWLSRKRKIASFFLQKTKDKD